MSNIVFYAGMFFPSIGGMQIQVQMLAEQFAALGHDVTVFTDTPSDAPDNFAFRVVRQITFSNFCSACRHADVIITSPLSLRRMPAPLLCLRPIIVIHANPLRGANGEMRVVDRIKQLLCYRTYNVVPGRFMAGYFPSPVTIRNPFDMALFHYEGQAKSKEVLFVGRLARIKGADVLIRAIAEIAPELPPFAVTIVGDGPEKENLQALAASLGQSQIIFAGSKQGAELAAIMRDHCILVVPSTYLEPSGLVTLEGLASGCLPIVSRRGGMRETIGPHGLDFENGDSLDLATKLKSVLIDPTIGERLMSGVENHLANHTAEAVAKTYLDLIAEILHEGPRD